MILIAIPFALIIKMASKPSSVVFTHFNIPDNRTERYKAKCKYCEESIRVAVFFLCFPSPWPHKTGSVGRNKIKIKKVYINVQSRQYTFTCRSIY